MIIVKLNAIECREIEASLSLLEDHWNYLRDAYIRVHDHDMKLRAETELGIISDIRHKLYEADSID